MNPYEIETWLATRLTSDYFLSSRPDHPHLFAAPDLVIGGNGSLVAVFLPHSNESGDAWPLQARLIAARLGLPKHTRCVLFDTREKRLAVTIYRNFHEVFRSPDWKQLIKFIRDKNAVGDVREVPIEIRKGAEIRFHTLFSIAESRSKRLEPGRGPIGLIRKLNKEVAHLGHQADGPIHDKRDLRRLGPLVAYDNSIIATKRFGPRGGDLLGLRTYCEYSIKRAYILDNGVPYPEKLQGNVLVVNRLPSSRLDPFKPLRAAAFAGWTVSTANNPDDVLDLTYQTNSTLKRRLK